MGGSRVVIVIPTVRLATAADAQGIAEMSKQYIEQDLGWSWTPARVHTAIKNESTNVAIVRDQNSLVGFGIMHYGDLTAHLALFAVCPSRRRRGFGMRLLSWLEKCAHTAGIEHIHVEARADNPGAISFYKKQGYLTIGRVAGYYRGVLDAVRLRKRLWGQDDPMQA